MSNVLFEGDIGAYRFKMTDQKTIEVWDDPDEDYPTAYINVTEGSVKSLKDFHVEISDWYMKNGI